MLLLALAGPVSARYSIDLRHVTYPALTYLNLGDPGPAGKEIRVNNLYMDVGGVPQLPVMGEIHYNRMDARYWRDALLKMKASGINIVATYCIWNLHEETEGNLSWKGNLDVRRFIMLCDELGLKVHLRIGPYCNAEIRNGGLPDWLVSNKQLETRSNHPLYLAYTRRWYEALYRQIKGLLYKDGGPIIALQLENEYVKPGQIIPHLTTLKTMAREIGMDVPVYSMTHWMDSEYPKGEIVPYAGFYIEAPWTASGKQEIPTGNFEFFTYNRLSDNIGTDIIKLDGQVESLSGENNDSPFFTCEVGVGTTAFYHRRAVVPQEMAGEMINLRLGCGANLMGYYMYAGGTNPVGELTTMQSSGPRVSYDYQAPVREYGTLGAVMPEVKKYNYFMNDFGTALAPAVAYLPTTNQNRENLQWAVRAQRGGESGFLFCSNYLYKHPRADFKNVQFSVRLADETLRMPRRKVTVRGGTYFFWPFNQTLSGVRLKYATAQPVCSHREGRTTTYFFFEDDGIPAEYLLEARSDLREVSVKGAECHKEKSGYFIDGIKAGTDNAIEAQLADGSRVRFVTLTEAQSDQIWKGRFGGHDYVALTPLALVADGSRLTLISDSARQHVAFYSGGRFVSQTFSGAPRHLAARMEPLAPLAGASWIQPASGGVVSRQFSLNTLSGIERAWLRCASNGSVTCRINNKEVNLRAASGYSLADVTSWLSAHAPNRIDLLTEEGKTVAAEVEILLLNGKRVVWNTDATWLTAADNSPVRLGSGSRPAAHDAAEHLAVYALYVPRGAGGDEETRLYMDYRGDVANLYQNGLLTADSYYDGTPWIVSVDRLREPADVNPIIVRIDGLKSADAQIYFEKNVNPAECVNPQLRGVSVCREYRFDVTPPVTP